MAHTLLDVMTNAARGVFPAADGGVTFLPALQDGNRAVVAFTGHAFIAAGLSARDFEGVDLDGFGAALSPVAVLRVADGGAIGVNDVTMVARGTGIGIAAPRTSTWDEHSRVRHARRIRSAVAVHGDERGFVTVSTGLAGRREVGVEIIDSGISSGHGRRLISDALGGTPADEFLFAAVSPGNARSLRSFLAAGFVPIGSEVIIDCASESHETPR